MQKTVRERMLRVGQTFLLCATTLAAEIHPMYSAQQQRSAPEALQIVVEQMEPRTLSREEYVAARVRARVERVLRSVSRIRKGATIEVRYTIFQPGEGYAGPRPMPHLKIGERRFFYGRLVERNGQGIWILEPVAGGRSFDTGEGETGFP